MNDLVTRLRSRKGEAITRVEKLMDEAAVHIEGQEKLIKEMREALEYAHKGLDMVHNGLMDSMRPRQSVGEVCHHFLGKSAEALYKSNPNTPERNDE